MEREVAMCSERRGVEEQKEQKKGHLFQGMEQGRDGDDRCHHSGEEGIRSGWGSCGVINLERPTCL